ncbi:MAG: hypothetical protein GX621_09505 [Pirellulaceae bacterium]|nr:hypothetical protein [Pirellulaceae bacterium]
MNPTCDDFRWLLGNEGRAWLDRTSEPRGATGAASAGARSEVAFAAALRRELSAERTHLILEQLELRRRARAKFVLADRMFFTRLGLEQATDQVVATYKARRLDGGVTFDLCCGIGGDLAALGVRGPAIGVDRNRMHALLARENARVAGKGGDVAVVVGDVTELHLDENIVWHLDPDRRADGRRSTQVAFHSPGLGVIEGMRGRDPDAAIKLAPAADPPAEWQAAAELEWISRQHECRQLVAWFGHLAEQPGLRRATILRATTLADEPEAYCLIGRPGRPREASGQIGRYVFEPDSAVLAADLTGELADQHALSALTVGGGYLTGDEPIESPLMARFEVLESLPFDKRRVKRLLAQREFGRLEIKFRGVPIQPDTLRRQLRVKGDVSGVLLLARRGESVTAIVARRLGYSP